MDIITLELSKKYCDDTASQFGAVKGANCKIAGNTKKDSYTELTFSWKNDANETRTTVVNIPHGLSVKAIEINEENHLIFTMSDNTKIDAGLLDVQAVITEDIKFTVDVGGVKAGTVYPKNVTPQQKILKDIATKEEPPVSVLSLTPNTTVYDIVTETLPSVTMKATITRKTYDVAKIEFYADDALINTVSTGVSDGGIFNFIYAPATPVKKTTVFKVVATDTEGNKSVETASNKITVSFVGKSYYGLVEPTVGEPTESQIKALNKKLKIVKGYVYSDITCDYNKVVYAYPQAFGALESIRDVKNNVNYKASFTRTSLKVDDIDYYCYTLNEPTGANGVELTFA